MYTHDIMWYDIFRILRISVQCMHAHTHISILTRRYAFNYVIIHPMSVSMASCLTILAT